MNRYAIAKLVQWAGGEGLSGRKRLQKVVYFLQEAGCSFDAEYSLHHYGPYSWEVAGACDQLVAAQILEEQADGSTYTYSVKPSGASALERVEANLGEMVAQIATYRELAVELLRQDLWELELGTTILFFYKLRGDWNIAVAQACEFKKIDTHHPSVTAAVVLAEKIYATPRAA